MKTRRALIAALVVIGVGALGYASKAQAAPVDCGGNQLQVTVPAEGYTCQQVRTIANFTLTATINVTAQGHATITYALNQPAPVAFPIRVRWHDGISSGPLTAEVSGIFPQGATSAVLTMDRCGNGQMDVKAVFVGNGDERGRVVAPYIITCTATVPAPTTTTAPTTSPATPTTAPGSPSTPSSAPTSSTVAGSFTIPATGRSSVPLVALGLVVVFLGMLVLAVRRAA